MFMKFFLTEHLDSNGLSHVSKALRPQSTQIVLESIQRIFVRNNFKYLFLILLEPVSLESSGYTQSQLQ